MSAGSTGSPVIDFSSLDFASVQSDLQAYAQGRFGELWTDFNAANFGSFLIELMAYVADLSSYNSNAQTMEAIIATMVREQNFRTAAKAFDYTLHSASPSSSIERITLDAGGTYPFTVSKHLQFSDETGIIFQPVGDTVVPSYPGVGYIDVPIVQGEESFEENVGLTNGRAGQSLTLGNSPLIDGTLTILIGAQPYTLVANSISSGPTAKIFTIATDEDGISTITFGDGINGAIPPSGQNVLATYKTGGGSNTNLPATVIDQVAGTSNGDPVPDAILSVSNTVKAENGGPKQSLASGKRNLPLSLKANDRAVTVQDYASLAVALVPGVLKASATMGTFSSGGRPIILSLVPQGGGNPTPTLINQVANALVDKKMGGKRIIGVPAKYVDLHIEVDAFVVPSASRVSTAQLVTNVLTEKYTLEGNDFGGDEDLELQKAYGAVDPEKVVIEGLRRCTFRRFSIKPHFDRYMTLSTIGTWDFSDARVDTTDDVKRREWAITVTSVGAFVVRQRILGVATAVTDTNITDDAAHFEAGVLAEDGWQLHVRPEEQDSVQTILSNSETSIEVIGGLLVIAAVGDTYAVEKVETNVGVIARTNPSGVAASGQPTIPVNNGTPFASGHRVLVREGSNSAILIVDTSGPTSLTFTENLPFGVTVAATLDWYWLSNDGTVGFALQNGPASFQSGDRLYVDTYPRVGDIRLRRENFPLLTDLSVNPIGGI